MKTYLSGDIPNRPRPGHQHPVIPGVQTQAFGPLPNAGQKAFSVCGPLMWRSAGPITLDPFLPYLRTATDLALTVAVRLRPNCVLQLTCAGTSADLSLILMPNDKLNLNQ